MSYDINSQQVDIENLFKQNVNDLASIKELYRKLKDLEKKITQIKYIDSNLADKLKKDYEKLKKVILEEYESLKRIILDENIQIQLSNRIDEINSELENIDNIKQNKGFLYDVKLNSVIDTYNLVPTDYYDMYNGLIAKYPTMFGKHELGKDQSGQYPIYLYQYKPTNYKNTILLICCVDCY